MLPSAPSHTAHTRSLVNPSLLLYAVNFVSRSLFNPPASVPIQRLPSRSSYIANTTSSDRPSRVVYGETIPFLNRPSPPGVATHMVPRLSSWIDQTLMSGNPCLVV